MKKIVKKHPLAIRWFHWINFPVLGVMICQALYHPRKSRFHSSEFCKKPYTMRLSIAEFATSKWSCGELRVRFI